MTFAIATVRNVGGYTATWYEIRDDLAQYETEAPE